MSLPQLEPELLLSITKSLKVKLIQPGLSKKLAYELTSRDVLVTDDDITAVADALKSTAYFIPTFVYNEAMAMAKAERETDKNSEPTYWAR